MFITTRFIMALSTTGTNYKQIVPAARYIIVFMEMTTKAVRRFRVSGG